MLFADLLPLLAEVTADNVVSTTIGVIGGVGAMIGTGLSGYFAYRAGRDKLQFDADRVRMQAELSQHKADVLRLTADEAECRKAMEGMADRMAKMEAKMDAERERSAEERHKLEAEVQKQRDLKHEINNRLTEVSLRLGMLDGNQMPITPLRTGQSTTTLPAVDATPKRPATDPKDM